MSPETFELQDSQAPAFRAGDVILDSDSRVIGRIVHVTTKEDTDDGEEWLVYEPNDYKEGDKLRVLSVRGFGEGAFTTIQPAADSV